MATHKRLKKMLWVLKNRQRNLTVILENIHDPHNVSAIFRTCEAVGIDKIHLLYTIESFPRIGKKSSGSAKKWIEIVKHKNHFSLSDVLKADGFKILATHLSHSTKSLYELDLTHPTAILFGNEHRGVSEEVLQIVDGVIYIPMFGMVESLNVSVAAAVVLFEACRQRLKNNLYPYQDNTKQWIDSKLHLWTKKSRF
jgi:tRNA (guanosine-2'-O-)-methyltransferase